MERNPYLTDREHQELAELERIFSRAEVQDAEKDRDGDQRERPDR